jgi:hypothetical protein
MIYSEANRLTDKPRRRSWYYRYVIENTVLCAGEGGGRMMKCHDWDIVDFTTGKKQCSLPGNVRPQR